MPLALAHGVVIAGMAGVVVRVEVHVAEGLPAVGVVGLPDASVNEARWRVRSALDSAGCTWPNRRMTIGLSPADVRKHGAGLDLPIAVGILAATAQVPAHHVTSTLFVGELGLDGRIHGAPGTLAGALAARRDGFAALIVPSATAGELRRLDGVRVCVADSLTEVVRLLRSSQELPPASAPDPSGSSPGVAPADLADVRGHVQGRFALEVAAAGGHHLALVGPPGVGKTLLADRLVGLLPDLDDDAAMEVAVLHSVAGQVRPDAQFTRPPERRPHHSASAAAVLGSVRGARAVPGAVTLAHRGVLVLDEAPEFTRPALEGLRQPLESGTVSVDRTGWAGTAPAQFQLALTANPCPCGQRVGTGAGCSCPPAAVRRYAARLSGPLMDRIDVRLPLLRPTDGELARTEPGESTARVADRVRAARDRSARRLADTPWRTNAEVPSGALRRDFAPADAAASLLRESERRSGNLRGPDRILRMAWTLADLNGRDRPGVDDIAVALTLRGSSTPWSA